MSGISWATEAPMSLVDWYRHKADQCARLAKEAVDPRKRANYKEERKLWLELAAEAEREQPGRINRTEK